jgi:hypothetical protein
LCCVLLTLFFEGWQPAQPRVPAALMREGMEDYEYLYQANCRNRPNPYEQNAVDKTVLSMGYSFGSWNKNEEQSSALRHELGKYLEGTRPDLPYLVTPKLFPYGSYNIDFRADPTNTNTPFQFNGDTWIPIDINQNFDVVKGFGVQSSIMGVQQSTGKPWLECVDTGQGNAIQRTVCYDNSNHNDYFFFSLFPGTYTVTVGLGMVGKTRRNDIEYVEINNVILRNATCSDTGVDCVGQREYTKTVNVHSHGPGGVLAMSFGSPYKNEYTTLSHLKIVAVSQGLCLFYYNRFFKNKQKRNN